MSKNCIIKVVKEKQNFHNETNFDAIITSRGTNQILFVNILIQDLNTILACLWARTSTLLYPWGVGGAEYTVGAAWMMEDVSWMGGRGPCLEAEADTIETMSDTYMKTRRRHRHRWHPTRKLWQNYTVDQATTWGATEMCWMGWGVSRDIWPCIVGGRPTGGGGGGLGRGGATGGPRIICNLGPPGNTLSGLQEK